MADGTAPHFPYHLRGERVSAHIMRRLAFNIQHWLAFNMEDSTYAGGLGAARPQPAERTITILLHILRSGRNPGLRPLSSYTVSGIPVADLGKVRARFCTYRGRRRGRGNRCWKIFGITHESFVGLCN